MVDEQPNKRPKKDYFTKRKESEDKDAVTIVKKRLTIEMCITKIGCTRFSRNEIISGKPDAESLERNSKGTILPVYATSTKYPGGASTITWKNASQTAISAKSLRCKIRGSVPRKD